MMMYGLSALALVALFPKHGGAFNHRRNRNTMNKVGGLHDDDAAAALASQYDGAAADADNLLNLPRSLQGDLLEVCAASTRLEFDDSRVVVVSGQNVNQGAENADACEFDVGNPVASYTLVGTGNFFFVTTCPPETADPNTIATTVFVSKLESIVAEGEEGYCLKEDFQCEDGDDLDEHCPTDPNFAASMSFRTELGAIYHIGIGGFSGQTGNFTMTVGEIGINPPDNNDCSDATSVVMPPDGLLILTGDNSDATKTEGDVCFGQRESTMWYAIQGKGMKITASTCSNATSFPSTISILESTIDDRGRNPPHCENLICADFDHEEDECQDLETVSWIAAEDTIYFIQVGSKSSGLAGAFELTIEERDPTPSELCASALESYLSSTVGSGCSCETLASEAAELTCVDCFKCDVAGSICSKSTEITTFMEDGGQDFTAIHEYDAGKNDTLQYDRTDDGSCTFSINAVECQSCAVQSCGGPLLDCSNIEPALIDVDFCDLETIPLDLDVASSALYAIISDEFNQCSYFQSGEACEANLLEVEAESGLTCQCFTESPDGFASMDCTTECGYFCNDEETACAVEFRSIAFEPTGGIASTESTFSYVIGNTDDILYISDYGTFCTIEVLSDTQSWSCSCEMATCEAGSSLPSMECSNGNGENFLYNFCAPTVVPTGIFEVLSDGEFDRCIDQSPTFDTCSEAIEINADGTLLVASTINAETPPMNACPGAEGVNGMWYTVMGTGSVLTLTTCHDDTELETFISISKGTCDALECITDSASEEQQCQLEWTTEMGVAYYLFLDNRNDFVGGTIGLTVEAAASPSEVCDDLLVEYVSDTEFNCACAGNAGQIGIVCRSICEEFCNNDGTACMRNEFGDFHELDGRYIGYYESFQYTSGREGAVFFEFDDRVRECSTKFILPGQTIAEAEECTSCEAVICPNGSLDFVLDCSNFPDGGVYNFCDGVMFAGDSVFEVFEDNNFETCAAGEGLSTTSPAADQTVAPAAVQTTGPTLMPSQTTTTAVTTDAPNSAPSRPTADTLDGNRTLGTEAPTPASAAFTVMTSMAIICLSVAGLFV